VRRNPYAQSVSFGPGPLTPAVQALIIANVAMFVVTAVAPRLSIYLGLTPAAVFGDLWLWQAATYAFLHLDLMHLVFKLAGAVDVRRRARAALGHTALRRRTTRCAVSAPP
jgi:membrane associated rhomboid family serine protease